MAIDQDELKPSANVQLDSEVSIFEFLAVLLSYIIYHTIIYCSLDSQRTQGLLRN